MTKKYKNRTDFTENLDIFPKENSYHRYPIYLLKKQEHKNAGKFSKTVYRILSLNNKYEEIYKEFMGEEPLNQQSIDNTESQPCPQKPYAVLRYTVNQPLIRIIGNKNQNTIIHTQHASTNPSLKNVCEEDNYRYPIYFIF